MPGILLLLNFALRFLKLYRFNKKLLTYFFAISYAILIRASVIYKVLLYLIT